MLRCSAILPISHAALARLAAAMICLSPGGHATGPILSHADYRDAYDAGRRAMINISLLDDVKKKR